MTNKSVYDGDRTVKVEKLWRDGEDSTNRPSELSIYLLRNGLRYSEQKMNATSGWTVTFDKLPAKDRNGNPYTYTVEEPLVDGYAEGVIKQTTDGFAITNVQLTTINGEKKWEGDTDHEDARPASIQVQLLAGGSVVKTTTATASDEWKFVFEDVPKYDNDGKLIIYTVKEVRPDTEEWTKLYTTTYNQTDYTIINTLTNAWLVLTKKIVDPTGEDSSNIAFKFQVSGITTDNTPINLKSGQSSTHLVKIGQSYQITETVPNGWTLSKVEGTNGNRNGSSVAIVPGTNRVTFTNTRKTADVRAEKKWIPESLSQDNNLNVQVQLMRNTNTRVGEPRLLNKAGGWSTTWSSLPATSADGKTNYTYTVSELTINGVAVVGNAATVNGVKYTVAVSGSENSGYTVINTQQTGSLTITKTIGENDDGSIHWPPVGSKFEIQYGSTPVSGSLFAVYEGNGGFSYQDANGNSISNTIDGIPIGTRIAVTEILHGGWNVGYKINGGTESGSNTIEIGNDSNTVEVVNRYAVSPTTLGLSGTKTLTGRAWKPGEEFTFSVKENGNEVATGVARANGAIAFTPSSITYTEAGEHTYTVTENVPDGVNAGNPRKDGTTYDLSEKTISVTVSDNGDGTLTANAIGSADFENVYSVDETTLELSGTKTLTGREWTEEDEFEFTLTETTSGEVADKLTAPQKTTATEANRNLRFDLAYTKPGVHTYEVKETNVNRAGITVDGTVYTVTVTVSDNGDGRLSVTPSANYNALNFTNGYEAEGSLTLSGEKTLNGRDLNANEFEFTVTEVDAEGNAIEGGYTQTAGHTEDGAIGFAPIVYDLTGVGTHHYRVAETAGMLGGVTYSDAAYTVDVDVTDNGDGRLSVTPSANYNALNFTNGYEAEGSLTLLGEKTLNGRDLNANEFEFTVTEVDAEGNAIEGGYTQTAGHTEDGAIGFAPIVYDLTGVGTHHYRVAETAGTLGGVTYSDAAYTVDVDVTDNGDGRLSVTPSANYNALNFTNGYEAEGSLTLSGEKTLNGRDLNANEFEFTVTEVDAEGNAIEGGYTQTTGHTADGEIEFGPITYDLAGVGTHYYQVTEVIGSTQGVTYDGTMYTVEASVADAGDGSLTTSVTKITKPGEGGEPETAEVIEFANEYEAEGSLTLSGEKRLNGRDLNANEFEFTVTEVDAEGNAIEGGYTQTAGHTADGAIGFAPITYDLTGVGTHHYRVAETAGTLESVTYDQATYTVVVNVADNGDGTLSVTPSANYDALNFTNAYLTTSVSGRKTWIDGNNDSLTRPLEITINLLQNGVVYAAQTVRANPNGEWLYSFDELPLNDEAGVAYTYAITEDQVEGYRAPEYDGYDVTNRIAQETISYTANKIWVDDPNANHPTITVRLYQNGIQMASAELPNGTLQYTFTGLPMYNSATGELYNYTVTEDEVAGYDTAIVGNAIYNYTVDNGGGATLLNIDELAVPLGFGGTIMNVGDCFE